MERSWKGNEIRGSERGKERKVGNAERKIDDMLRKED